MRLFVFSLICIAAFSSFGMSEEEIAAKSPNEKVLLHQEMRFKLLEEILAKDPKYLIRFPGKDFGAHALGVGAAVKYWHPKEDHAAMVERVRQQIVALARKFPGRVHFGAIGDFGFDHKAQRINTSTRNPVGTPGLQAGGAFVIHVWGANVDNFNLPEGTLGPFGSGQAASFRSQRPGVFGIVTVPSHDHKKLLAPDLLADKY